MFCSWKPDRGPYLGPAVWRIANSHERPAGLLPRTRDRRPRSPCGYPAALFLCQNGAGGSSHTGKMTLSIQLVTDLIEVVRDTGRREIMPHFRNLPPQSVQTKDDAKDFVTDADRAAEKAITDAVSKLLPKAVVVGEEAVAHRPGLLDAIGTAQMSLIVDPIDGTGNFVAGLAVFGTIVAVVENGETTFGLLYDPVIDDWIFAIRGEGAFFANNTGMGWPVAPRPALPIEMAKGFLPLDDYEAMDRTTVMDAFASVYQIQDIRCSCHEYRLLASGQADFLRSFRLNPWDHAAGLLVLQEAGGWARVDGTKSYVPTLRNGSVIAATCQVVGERIVDLSARLH